MFMYTDLANVKCKETIFHEILQTVNEWYPTVIHAFWGRLGDQVYEAQHNFVLLLIPIQKTNFSFLLKAILTDMQ